MAMKRRRHRQANTLRPSRPGQPERAGQLEQRSRAGRVSAAPSASGSAGLSHDGETRPPARRWILLAGLVIVATGAAAYSNSFTGPFIYDGKESIVQNPYIRRLWPITEAIKAPPQATTSGRPVVSLSLAVSYATSMMLTGGRTGLDVWPYHAFNLAVHLAAALLLFGVIRRTLLTRRLVGALGRWATVLAGISALLWAVHPLQTEAVTYVIQRAESMMGLLYLLTVYCVIRGAGSRRPGWWYAAAVVACAAGMATKEVMVTAPLVVIIYDRIFLARSWKELLSRRRGLYAGLLATWIVLAVLVSGAPRSRSAGFGLRTFGPIEYAKTQCKVIIHYIRLAFWPSGLVLDYTRKGVGSFAEFGPQGLALLAMLAATGLALRYAPAVGFLGAWLFLILGPTSSFLPIADPAFEHRMYLPLAAIVTAVVVGGYWLGRRLACRTGLSQRLVAIVALALAAVAAGALAATTYARNTDYRDEITIWRDTVAKQPGNFMAWATLAANYANRGMTAEAIATADRAIELHPRMSYAYNARAVAHEKAGDLAAAIADFTRAIETDPTHARPYMNRAELYRRTGRIDQAVADCNESIRLDPRYEPTYLVRGLCRMARGMTAEAVADFSRAIQLNPAYVPAYLSRAEAYAAEGSNDRAIADLRTVLKARPGDKRATKLLWRLLSRRPVK